jgi:hypothetical protein
MASVDKAPQAPGIGKLAKTWSQEVKESKILIKPQVDSSAGRAIGLAITPARNGFLLFSDLILG